MVGMEFHFDFGSPNAYMAHLVIPEIERRTGVEFEYVPILLGGVFKLTNNRSPAESLAGIKNKRSESSSSARKDRGAVDWASAGNAETPDSLLHRRDERRRDAD